MNSTSGFLAHYGQPKRSGRYPYGSGKRPYQGDPKRALSQEKVFVSGSSKTQDPESGYYRKKLPKEIRQELKKSIKNRETIIVGDAPGIDRQVQDFLMKYSNVIVYGPGSKVRYQANPEWESRPIDAPEYEVGSKEWLAKKDIEMTNASTRGLAVVLDEGAAATRKNVDRLIAQNKNVKVFELNKNGKKHDRWW